MAGRDPHFDKESNCLTPMSRRGLKNGSRYNSIRPFRRWDNYVRRRCGCGAWSDVGFARYICLGWSRGRSRAGDKEKCQKNANWESSASAGVPTPRPPSALQHFPHNSFDWCRGELFKFVCGNTDSSNDAASPEFQRIVKSFSVSHVGNLKEAATRHSSNEVVKAGTSTDGTSADLMNA